MRHNQHRSHDLLWLSIALTPLIGISFLLEIQPQDFWWLMRVGRVTIQNAAVPAADTISWSRAGAPIVYQPWLAGVILYLVYSLGGISLIFLLRGAIIAVAYGMIWQMAREASAPPLATILVFVLGIASANNWSVRSQLFAYPLFAFCVWSLLQWQNGGKKHLWVLPICALLWANLHGSFILPFALAGAALLLGRGDKKALLIALGAMLPATLVNPHGLRAWNYVMFMLNSPSDQLFAFEWAPPRNDGWQMNLFFGWTLLFVPLAALSKNKLSTLEWILFLGFGWLAFSGVRYVIWFLFLLAIFTAKLIAEWSDKWIDKPIERIHPRLNLTVGLALFLLPLLLLPGIRDLWWRDAPPLYELSTTPIEAVEFLKAHEDLPGPLWNDYAFGSYLHFALPSRPTWMDTRMYSFPQEQWQEYVRVSGAEGWREMFDREGINLLLLSQAAQPKLVKAVTESDEWCEEYRDDYAVIFSRCEAK